jgi:hypothetical protein
MPVRLGDIELRSVQDVRADDNRTLVELRVPGQSGSVFQDLGRAPATVVLAGLLVGEHASDILDRLRAAYQKAKPLAFASDIAIGAEMTEIVIADLLVRQEAGYRDRYRYTVKLREHIEPPENAAANQAAVDASVKADAAAWADDAALAGDALAEPAGLADALAGRPEILAHMSADQLGESIGGSLEALDASKLGDVMDTVGTLDPAKGGGMLAKLNVLGKLGAFVDKLLSVGRTIVGVARKLGGILMHVGELMDLVKAAQTVAARAKALWTDALEFKDRWSIDALWRPPADALEPFVVPSPTPRAVFLRVRDLSAALAELVGMEILKKVRDLAREYGLGGIIDAAARALITAVEAVGKLVDLLRKLAAVVAGLWLITELGARLGEVVVATGDLLADEERQDAESMLRDLRWASALLRAAPGPGDVDALGAALDALAQSFRHFTLADVAAPATVPALPGAAT